MLQPAPTSTVAPACANGDGNGRIDAPNAAGTHEELVVWNHLSATGFLQGGFSSGDATPTDTNSPKNAYTVYMQVAYDNNYGTGAPPNRHNMKTGGQIPVEIIAEVDRKIDDGNPHSGPFQFSTYAPAAATAPNATTCINGTDWNIQGGDTNCAAAGLF